MAKVLILGGGFGGVVAAERLAEQLSDDHQITLVSRSRQFVFYPALVRLAFGKCREEDVSFDLRRRLLNRRINFVEAEVVNLDPHSRKATIAHGEVEGKLPYDYLIFALGRRLATEHITGFHEHAHHLLNVDKAIKFGKAIRSFQTGSAVFGQCQGARLPVPVYESAFALARLLEEKGKRDQVKITIVGAKTFESELEDFSAPAAVKQAMATHQIDFLPNLSINSVTRDAATTTSGESVDFDLLMLVPPFKGSSVASRVGLSNDEGYINVDSTMRVIGHERIFAAGDCVNFAGPKMGQIAIRQGEVAAANLAAEIVGRQPATHYWHDKRVQIDQPDGDGVYLRKDLWPEEPTTIRQSQFWNWAKGAQSRHWELSHS